MHNIGVKSHENGNKASRDRDSFHIHNNVEEREEDRYFTQNHNHDHSRSLLSNDVSHNDNNNLLNGFDRKHRHSDMQNTFQFAIPDRNENTDQEQTESLTNRHALTKERDELLVRLEQVRKANIL